MIDPGFRLADGDWSGEIARGMSDQAVSRFVVSPFIKLKSARRFLRRGDTTPLRVITRFNLNDFNAGVSDIDALAVLLAAGAEIRGIQGLHSKLYVFGDRRCIVTSANLTESGLLRNWEFGFVSTDLPIIAECREYCDRLWVLGRENLEPEKLNDWRDLLREARRSASPTAAISLPDFGAPEPGAEPPISSAVEPQTSSFIKFFGSANNRALRSMTIMEEVTRSGSHWACTYPKRPRQVADGDIMFMARMVRSPDDYMIYGDAIGRQHVDEEDVASTSDLQLREWKKDWPYYVRVHRPRFANGTLANGVSMNRLMEELGSNAFAVTQSNAAKGAGNISPRRALMQQPAVKLSPIAGEWLRRELDRVYAVHGQIDLASPQLDWPA